MQVGYLGLGVMGGALARRLLKSRPVRVFDLNTGAVSLLVDAGGTAEESPASLAAHSDVVFLCLPRSQDVHAVLFGTGGLASAAGAGTVIVDQTSGDPTQTREMAAELAARDVHLVDAPVSGGAAGADAGTIAIMVGGPEAAVARVRPILEEISPNIFVCGEIGAGQVMKLVNNTVSATNRCAMLESVVMGLKNGLDLQTITDVLNAGGARSRATEMMLPALVRGEPDAHFQLALMLKDLNLSADLASKTGVPHQFGQMTRSTLQSALNVLGPDANYFDISGYLAHVAGTEFKST